MTAKLEALLYPEQQGVWWNRPTWTHVPGGVGAENESLLSTRLAVCSVSRLHLGYEAREWQQ